MNDVSNQNSTWKNSKSQRGKCHNKTATKTTVSLYLSKKLVKKTRIHKLNLSRITEQALTSILDYLETQNTTKSSKFLAEASFLKEDSRAGSSVWYERRLRKAEAAGSNPARSTMLESGLVSVKEGIIKTVWELKKQGHAESTIKSYNQKLKTLSRLTNLNNPQSVRASIAEKKCSNAFKEALVNAYDHYARVNWLSWSKPLYRRQRGVPYIATAEQIDKIISRASKKYALIFSFLRDTGVRPIEAHNLTLK